MNPEPGPEPAHDPDPQRNQAVATFLTAGLHEPPSAASMVSALASARRAVALHRARGSAIDPWLADEVRLRGIRENAAVLAALETTNHRTAIADTYRQQNPDRADALNALLESLPPATQPNIP